MLQLFVLVIPSPTYGVSGLPQALSFFFWRAFLTKDMCWSKTDNTRHYLNNTWKIFVGWGTTSTSSRCSRGHVPDMYFGGWGTTSPSSRCLKLHGRYCVRTYLPLNGEHIPPNDSGNNELYIYIYV